MLISAFIFSIGISLVQPTQTSLRLSLNGYAQSEEIPFSSLSKESALSDANGTYEIASYSFSFSCPGYIIEIPCKGNTFSCGYDKFNECMKEKGQNPKTKVYFDKIELVSKKNPAERTKGAAVFVIRMD